MDGAHSGMTLTIVKRMGLFGGPMLGLLCYSLLPRPGVETR